MHEGNFAITSGVNRGSEIVGVAPDTASAGAYRVCDDGANCSQLDVVR